MSPHHHRLEEAGKGLQNQSAVEHFECMRACFGVRRCPADEQTGIVVSDLAASCLLRCAVWSDKDSYDHGCSLECVGAIAILSLLRPSRHLPSRKPLV